jgi:DNA-binding PadR family transcriptional regulator
MPELAVLALVSRYSHPAALARRARSAVFFPTLRRLERQGLVTGHRDVYRLTRLGKHELELQLALRSI